MNLCYITSADSGGFVKYLHALMPSHCTNMFRPRDHYFSDDGGT